MSHLFYIDCFHRFSLDFSTMADVENDLLDYEEEEQTETTANGGSATNGAAKAAAGAGDAAAAAKKDAPKGNYVSIHSSGFRDFLLKPEILRAIVDCGFEHPSEGEYFLRKL